MGQNSVRMGPCSQLLSWSFVHEGLSSFNGSEEISEVRLVLDASAIHSIIKLSSEYSASNLLGEGLTIEGSWESGILL